ncbi:MAG: hypothetical protein K2L34_07090 [Muribaculaceae bacterium]|nr:hypothetical protein [Muribaculaceae bacterium]
MYDPEEEDLLEYVIAVANKFAPDFIYDNSGTVYKSDSQAPFIFKRRYNFGKLNRDFTYSDYIRTDRNDNETVIDIIKALGIDVEKFWYLLLFVFDYAQGSTVETLVCNSTPKQEIEKLIGFVEQNEDTIDPLKGIRHKEPMKLTLQIKGHRLIIENPNTISAIAWMCKQLVPAIENGSCLNSGATHNSSKSNSIRIWLFAQMLRYFFQLYPDFTVQRKIGNAPTRSTLRLISKLVYLTKLTTNEDYNSDDENLKALLKQYRNHKLNTINAIYG